MQAWQAWKLSLVRQEGVDASSFCLAGGRGGVLMIHVGRTFCTVDGVDMKVHVLGTVNNKKGEFQSGEDCSSSNRDGMGWG